MITVTTGPLVVQPACWQVVFSRETSRRWVRALAAGEFKHVSAYAYVPFLHVWVFYDPYVAEIIVAADGDPALAMISSRVKNAAVVSVKSRIPKNYSNLPILGHCVPAIRRLVGISGRSLTPSGFFKECLAQGGELLR